MTVRISKPALNLREKLTELDKPRTVEQQQFWFDSLVTNGTFDNDISWWTDNSTGTGSISWNASGYLDLNTTDVSNRGEAEQAITIVANTTYVLSASVTTTVDVNIQVWSGSNQTGTLLFASNGTTTGDYSFTFNSLSFTTCYVVFQGNGAGANTVNVDNISVHEVDENGDVIHSLPLGWKPLHVYEEGLLQREGDVRDYTVINNGFDYKVKPAVAPGASTETCVIAEREL